MFIELDRVTLRCSWGCISVLLPRLPELSSLGNLDLSKETLIWHIICMSLCPPFTLCLNIENDQNPRQKPFDKTNSTLNIIPLCLCLHDTRPAEQWLCEKATVYQVTTMLTTSKSVLFPGHNHLLSTGTDDPTLIIARAPASEGSSVLVISRWLWPENSSFSEVVSMVVTWWIVAFLCRTITMLMWMRNVVIGQTSVSCVCSLFHWNGHIRIYISLNVFLT